MGAYVVFGLYAQQGNTASHSKGMIDGLVHATATGIGSGFGTFGYLSSNRTDGVAESLLGLYFGWMGLPMVLIVGLVACRLAQNLRAETESSRLRVLWLAVGVLAASALSETASALSATGLTWMLFGMALAGGRDLMSSADDATSQPRFPQLAKDYADLPPATGSTTAGKWPPGPRSVLRPNWSPQPPLAPARTYPDVVTRLTV
jgi:hypothetical protein